MIEPEIKERLDAITVTLTGTIQDVYLNLLDLDPNGDGILGLVVKSNRTLLCILLLVLANTFGIIYIALKL